MRPGSPPPTRKQADAPTRSAAQAAPGAHAPPQGARKGVAGAAGGPGGKRSGGKRPAGKRSGGKRAKAPRAPDPEKERARREKQAARKRRQAEREKKRAEREKRRAQRDKRRRVERDRRRAERDLRRVERYKRRRERRRVRLERRQVHAARRRARRLALLLWTQAMFYRFSRLVWPEYTRRLPKGKAVLVLVLNVAPFPGLGTVVYGKWERGIAQFLLTFVFLLGLLWAVLDGVRIVHKAFESQKRSAERARRARSAQGR